jgi:sulfoacetaldehyde acetyltransferase
MTPSEAFVETLVANGVTDMFGIMGSAFMDAMDIFAPAGIRLIPVVHEQGAGHMADGYARVSGRHGVVIGQNGPGISNCVTAIAAAYWAHSPVVIITPETGTMGMGLGGFQEANQLPMFQEFTKYQGHVTTRSAWPNTPAAASTARSRRWARRSSTSRATTSTARSPAEIPQPQRLGPRPRRRAQPRRGGRAARDGEVPGDHRRRRRRHGRRRRGVQGAGRAPGAPVVNSYLHNDSSRPATRCGPARWATRARRRR